MEKNKKTKKIDLKKLIKDNVGSVIGISAILILLIILVVLLLIGNHGSKSKVLEEGVTENVSKGIVKDEKYEGLSFTNVSLVKNDKDKQYTLTAEVTNTTNKPITTQQVDIVLKDGNQKEIITLLGYIGDNGLQPNETKTITAITSDSVDLSKAIVKEIKAHE